MRPLYHARSLARLTCAFRQSPPETAALFNGA